MDITAMVAEAIVDAIKRAEVGGLKAPEDWPPIMRKTDVKRCCEVSDQTIARWWTAPDFPSRDNGAWIGRDAFYRWLNRVV
jgi:hypothetical protein